MQKTKNSIKSSQYLNSLNAVASIPHGLEGEGAQELDELGAKILTTFKGGVSFTADIACFYRLHLQARLPFRILREIARFSCDSPEILYSKIQNTFEWDRWLHPSKSFRVDVSGSTHGLTHSHFTALQVKNALVDFQRKLWGERSSIDLNSPDLCLHLHLGAGQVVLSLDGLGTSLHRRGYRPAMGRAPIKENLAAGLVRKTGWESSLPLVDPLCGSATFLIEAVSNELKLAPGLNRNFLFEGWPDFDKRIWFEEKKRAKLNESTNKKLFEILGCEQDQGIANQARNNIQVAGLAKIIKIQNSHFCELSLPNRPGIIVCNPPYGKRLGNVQDLELLYKELGAFLKRNASGWQLWVLSGNKELSGYLGMKCSRRFPISNGGIDCRWLKYCIR